MSITKTKKYILLIMTIIMLISSSLGIFIKNKTQDVLADSNPATWLLCKDDVGKAIYNGAKTDVIPFNIKSKSAVNYTEDNYVMYNEILRVSGFKIGKEATGTINPFDKFGLAGLHYSAYSGEWKYYIVDACAEDSTKAKKGDYGKFYKDRREPKATYDETSTSTDPRVKQFDKGFFSHWWVAIGNNISNFLLNISKLVVTFALTLLSLSFKDLSEFIGLDEQLTTNMFKSLYDSFYQPLILVMFAFTAIYMMYFGLFKRQYRNALNTLGVSLLCFFVAIVITLKPGYWIKMPNSIVTAAQALVIQGLQKGTTGSGDLCTTNAGFNPPSSGSKSADQSLIEGAGENIRSTLGCKMWEEFLLKPWAEAQFGTKYNDLQASSVKNGNSTWVKEPTVELGGKSEKNWALFQISAQTTMHTPVGKERHPLISGVQADWYRIVDAFSNYQEKDRKVKIGSDGEGEEGTSGGAIGKSAGGEAFFKEYGEFAKKVADEAGLYASVLLAQAALESGYGKALSGDYNYFGIKCYDGNCKRLATTEVYGGKSVGIVDGFQNFKSAEDGFEGYAHFILGRGAGADFTGGMKKNSSTPQEAIQKIWKAGYATDPAYVSKIVSLIESYNLTQYDTDRKEQGDPEKYPIELGKGVKGAKGGGINDDGSEGQGTEITIPEQIPSDPLPQWQDWIGNNLWSRLGQTLVLIVFTIIGVIAPVIVGFLAAVLSISITLLMMFSPIFLLLGCWGGKGQKFFLGWFSLLLSLMLKKIFATVLLVLTIIIVTTIMGLISKLGYIKTLVFLAAVTKAIVANKDVILEKLPKIDLGGFNLAMGWREGYNKVKKAGKTVATTGYAGAVGFKNAAKNGVTGKEGFKSGSADYLKNSLYKSKFGRNVMRTYNETTDTRQDRDSNHVCSFCGTPIHDGTSMFIDKDNNRYCKACGDENQDYNEMTEVVANNNHKGKHGDNPVPSNITQKDFQEITEFKQDSYTKKYSFNRTKTIGFAHQHIDAVIKGLEVKKGAGYTNIVIPPVLSKYINPVQLERAWESDDKEIIQEQFVNGWEQLIRELNELNEASEEQIEKDISMLRERYDNPENEEE